jgi:hypothetical protein
MTYEEYRLWKHKQRREKKRAEMMTIYGEEQPYDLKPEPEFKTYQEFEAWKLKNKQEKKQTK